MQRSAPRRIKACQIHSGRHTSDAQRVQTQLPNQTVSDLLTGGDDLMWEVMKRDPTAEASGIIHLDVTRADQQWNTRKSRRNSSDPSITGTVRIDDLDFTPAEP